MVEAGDCEVETLFERQKARDSAAARESSIQLGCGIGRRTELAAAFARQRSERARDESIGLEAKTLLRKGGGAGVAWSLAYGMASERGDGTDWRRGEHFVAVEAALRPAVGWRIEARVGTARDHAARKDKTLWALAAEHAITDTVEVRAELGGDDREPPLAGIALRWQFWPERALLTLSGGAKAGPTHERRIGLGIIVEF